VGLIGNILQTLGGEKPTNIFTKHVVGKFSVWNGCDVSIKTENWQLFINDAKNKIWTNEGRNKTTDTSERNKYNV
jgi:hypothetical protein